MAQTEIELLFAFFAFWAASRATPPKAGGAKRAYTKAKGAEHNCSALLFSHWLGARVARQRCPILQSSGKSVSDHCPFAKGEVLLMSKGTFLLCKLGDISTLP
jgi:hypothetical protein